VLVYGARELSDEEQRNQVLYWDGMGNGGDTLDPERGPFEGELKLRYREVRGEEGVVSAEFVSNLIELDLDIFEANAGPRVPEENEESIGAIEIVNDDDDGLPEGPDNDNEEIDEGADTLDMIKLRLICRCPETFIDGKIELIADKIPECKEAQVRIFNEDDEVVNLPEEIDVSRFEEDSIDYFVEGIEPGILIFKLRARDPEGKVVAEDIVKLRVGVEIVMTFDDGPVGDKALGSGENYTENILNDLASNRIQNNIKATFFLLTHMDGRGGTTIGEQVMVMENNQGHILAAHGGGLGDHIHHTERVILDPYDVDSLFGTPDGIDDGENALESDLIAAKRKINELTGQVVEFVRPPEWKYREFEGDTRVIDTYERQELKMILRDIYSRDGGFRSYAIPPGKAMLKPRAVRYYLKSYTEDIIEDEKIYHLVAVLHDWNDWTAENFADPEPSYLDAIVAGAEEAGVTKECIIFIDTPERIREILRMRDNWPTFWPR
ncbi:polysaccharide deacetylase family protein, partial [candidate division WOR-3 bacterium]|nr:polysaccharide deacetylase family protein [candidate division WOR-3 bacterium]